MPVSSSTSTNAMWVPNGNVQFGRVVVGRLVEVRLHALGRVEREVERERDLLDRLLLVGRALDAVLGAVDLDVVERRLEHVRRVAPRLLADLAAALSAAPVPTLDVREPYEP